MKKKKSSVKKKTNGAPSNTSKHCHCHSASKKDEFREDELSEYFPSEEESEEESLDEMPGTYHIRRDPIVIKKSQNPRKPHRKYTEEERKAIMASVAKFGKGKWKEIKTYSGAVLSKRSTVQIKDCHRTILRQQGGRAKQAPLSP